MTQANRVTIVTGLPRSGTSLMMQMLAAGGMPILTDALRTPDDDNPRGYLEYEPVKTLKTDSSWLRAASGKAVKMVHLLLADVPVDIPANIILMRRDIREVLTSQRKMLERSGKTPKLPDAQLAAIYDKQLAATRTLITQRPSWRLLEINYAAILRDPPTTAAEIGAFLGLVLDPEKMVQTVDPALYRNR